MKTEIVISATCSLCDEEKSCLDNNGQSMAHEDYMCLDCIEGTIARYQEFQSKMKDNLCICPHCGKEYPNISSELAGLMTLMGSCPECEVKPVEDTNEGDNN